MMIMASEPCDSELPSLVVHLDGCHAEMNVLGCIGHLIFVPGLQELLEDMYSPNTVTHIWNDKSCTKKQSRHLLMDSALNATVTDIQHVTKLVSHFQAHLFLR